MLKNVSPKLIENVKDLKISLNELTVYDLDVYSSIEIYYKVANKLNEVIRELSRFEGVLTDEVISQNEKLSYLLNEGLENEIIKEVDNLLNNGVIENILNVKIFSDLKSELQQKANKTDVFSMANMGQDIKEAMTGGSVAVVGKNTIITENIVDGQVTPLKISNFNDNLGVNLFSATKAIQGQYVNDKGLIIVDPSYTAGRSHYIEVDEGCEYEFLAYTDTLKYLGGFFNSNKMFVGHIQNLIPTGKENIYRITAPKGVKYFVLNYSDLLLNKTFFRKVENIKINWLELNEKNISDIENLIDNKKIEPNKIETKVKEITGENLATNILYGYYVNPSDGVLKEYPDSQGLPNESGVTDFIEVKEGCKYKYIGYDTTGNANGCIYNSSKVKIGNLKHVSIAGRDGFIVMPKGACYVRLNFSNLYDNVYFNEIINYKTNLEWLKVNNSNIENKTLTVDKFSDDLINELKSTNILDGSVTLKGLAQDVINFIKEPTSDPINPFANLKTTWIGDSITVGVGTSSYSNRYSELVTSNLGMSKTGYQNLGVSGSVIARKNPSDIDWNVKSFVERVCDEEQIKQNQDIIFCLGGVNDFARKTPISSMEDSIKHFETFGSWDDTTFYGALHRLFTYIRNNHVNSQFIFISTIHYRNENIQQHDIKLKDYINAIREVCEYYAVPLIDLYKNLPLDPKNDFHNEKYTRNGYLTSADGCHPSDEGNSLIAEYITKWLKNNFVK